MEINKWCQPHWDMLREAVFSKGMGHLVPKSGEAAARMLEDELKFGSRRDAEGFDPLMRGYWAISGRVLKASSNPFECPLCQVQRHHDTCKDPECRNNSNAQAMVNSCTNALRDYVREKGLLQTPSS